ncbi:MAG: 30S ribosome-binding factor RbfA [Deltaproteobacteria bacterium]|nr:30S ribosome-binding factor RbfA [Deltaproteobacteria bacterium]MBW1959859.1 30S ribosome-binding factor RbfA [Deltaproteobacteria bacterium]MBW1996077.1 30S ribosome-binding factor RbfA [Deltaproteobacteria bacterium]MBW2150373.1 30S ribosome-binding factor RbfA [Deltaproteobacteria bacterium]
MRSYTRAVRVGILIQQVLSDVLRKNINDPRLKMTVISAVKMSADLKTAKIYYTAPGDEKSRRKAAEGFEKATGFFKRSLAREISLRYMPDLQFFLDESVDYGFHIERLLTSIKEKNGSDHTTIEKQ